MLVASNRFRQDVSTSAGQGRIAYEADVRGQLRKVDAARSAASLAPPPLWKPEASLLLARSTEMSLTPDQIRRIGRIARAWQDRKESLVRQMSAETETAEKDLTAHKSANRASIATIRGRFADYSEVSRAYDRARRESWLSALGLLTESQRRKIAAGDKNQKEAR